jgi:hypothetical protein
MADFFMDFNSLNKFGGALCKEHPCKVSIIYPSCLGGEVV